MKETDKDSLDPLMRDIRECSRKLKEDMFLDLLRFAGTIHGYLESWLINQPTNRQGFWILHLLVSRSGRMTPTEVSRILLCPKYSTTRIINNLEKQGLVKREPFGDDRRTRDIVITKEGVKIIDAYLEYFQMNLMPRFLRDMDKKQVEEFHILVLKLREYLMVYKQKRIKLLSGKRNQL